MKILISKALVIVMAVNLLLACTSYADSADMQVYFDSTCVSSVGSVESVEGDYYLNNRCLNDFDYHEGAGEIYIDRYGTELKITFGSDSVSVNGKTELFTKPIYRTNETNYISLRLIALVFGSDIKIDDKNNKINISLKAKPSMPEKKTIKGTLKLPGKDVAPQSGISFKISAGGTDIYSDENVKYVTLDSGKNKVDFEVPIIDDSYDEYSVMYQILDGYNFDKYVSIGYYSYNGTRSSEQYLSKILPSGKTKINLDVIGTKPFLAKINRNGYTGGVGIHIDCGEFYDSDYVEGSEFSTLIPTDADKVYLNYNLDDESNYINEGYCGKNGTAPFYETDNYIDLKNGSDNAVINILKGKKITGKVSFPEALRNESCHCTLNAEISGNSIRSDIYKQKGLNEVNYSMVVPKYENNKYILQFGDSDFNCYISAEGNIVTDKSLARVFDFSNTDSLTQDINVEQPKIYGVVSLPDNETAPVGGIDANVTINYSYNNKSEVSLKIPEGQNNINYEVPLSFDDLYYSYLDINCSADDGRYEYGDSLDLNNEGLSIQKDIMLNKMSKITGTISLPPNEIAPKDLVVNVFYGNYETNTIIPAGQSSAEYSLMAGQNESNEIGYNFDNEEKYLSGFYSESGTTFDPTNTEKLTLNSDISGIDMQTKEAPYISGTISLPQSMEPLSEDLDIGIMAGNNNAFVTIPQGKMNAPFNIYIQQETLDTVGCFGYSLYKNDIGLCRNGFYNSVGTASGFERNAGLFTGDKAENINITLLKTVEITGKISLPDKKTAKNDIDVCVSAVPDGITDAISDDFIIKQGESSCTYKINVPEDYKSTKYKLNYYLSDCDEYYERGYYNSAGTTSREDKAAFISKENGLDMTLINVKNVFGTVSSPIRLISPMDITVNSTDFKISGNTSNFSIKVPLDEPTYTVKYSIYGSPGSSIFKDMGFFNSSSENSVTPNEEEAQSINLKDNTNINFTLPLLLDEYPLQIDNVYSPYDLYDNYNYDDENYDEYSFVVTVANKSQQDIEGTVFLVSYDSEGKIIAAFSKKATLQKMAMNNVDFKIEPNEKLYENDKIKIYVWNDKKESLTDMAKPKTISQSDYNEYDYDMYNY